MTVGNDLELAHYQANGATSNNLQDAEREFLLLQVPGGIGANQDLWFTFLRAQGFTGALDDMRYNYWNNIDLSPIRLFAILTPVDFVSGCSLDVYGGDFNIDWGDGLPIFYAGGNPSSVNVVPTGNILIYEEMPINRIQFVSNTLTSIDIKNGSNLTSANSMCQNLSNLNDFQALSMGGINDFASAWIGCNKLTSFPAINVSNGLDFSASWLSCSSLLSFPTMKFTKGVDFSLAWQNCSMLEYVGSLSTLAGSNFAQSFKNCTSLKCLTDINTVLQNNTTDMFNNTPALIAPNATEQTAILAGSNYVNAGVCPPDVVSVFANLIPVDFVALCSMSIYGGDFTIDWGDGNEISYTGGNPAIISVVPTGDIVIKEVGPINRIVFSSDTFLSIDIVNGTNLTSMFSICQFLSSLTSFTSLLTGGVTNFSAAFDGCSGLNSFAQIDSSAGINFIDMFQNCTSLVCLTNINTLLLGNTIDMFNNTPALIAPNATEQTAILVGSNYVNAGVCPPEVVSVFANLIPVDFVALCSMSIYGGDFTIDWGDGNEISYTGGNPAIISVVPTGDIVIKEVGSINRIEFSSDTFLSIDIQDGRNLISADTMCKDLSSLTSFSASQMGGITNFNEAWFNCTGLTSFSNIDTVSGTTFIRSWQNCSSLITFPVLDFSSAIDFTSAFRDCILIVNLPVINAPSVTNFTNTWRNCDNLESIGMINSVSGTIFSGTFNNCRKLICLTDINTLLQTNVSLMFNNNDALISPNAAEQTAILSGDNYVNGSPCP